MAGCTGIELVTLRCQRSFADQKDAILPPLSWLSSEDAPGLHARPFRSPARLPCPCWRPAPSARNAAASRPSISRQHVSHPIWIGLSSTGGSPHCAAPVGRDLPADGRPLAQALGATMIARRRPVPRQALDISRYTLPCWPPPGLDQEAALLPGADVGLARLGQEEGIVRVGPDAQSLMDHLHPPVGQRADDRLPALGVAEKDVFSAGFEAQASGVGLIGRPTAGDEEELAAADSGGDPPAVKSVKCFGVSRMKSTISDQGFVVTYAGDSIDRVGTAVARDGRYSIPCRSGSHKASEAARSPRGTGRTRPAVELSGECQPAWPTGWLGIGHVIGPGTRSARLSSRAHGRAVVSMSAVSPYRLIVTWRSVRC